MFTLIVRINNVIIYLIIFLWTENVLYIQLPKSAV